MLQMIRSATHRCVGYAAICSVALAQSELPVILQKEPERVSREAAWRCLLKYVGQTRGDATIPSNMAAEARAKTCARLEIRDHALDHDPLATERVPDRGLPDRGPAGEDPKIGLARLCKF